MKQTILMVEDDISNAKIIQKQLEKAGYEVLMESSGEKALETMKNAGYPMLVLMDWKLPDIEGIDVLKAYRSTEKTARHYVIFVTIMGKIENIIEGLDSGADDYITKPFYLPILISRIKSGFRLLSLQRELETKIEQLQSAEKQITTLQKIIPICMYCHKIRSEKEIWERLENYITDNYNTLLSHGICPDCFNKLEFEK